MIDGMGSWMTGLFAVLNRQGERLTRMKMEVMGEAEVLSMLGSPGDCVPYCQNLGIFPMAPRPDFDGCSANCCGAYTVR